MADLFIPAAVSFPIAVQLSNQSAKAAAQAMGSRSSAGSVGGSGGARTLSRAGVPAGIMGDGEGVGRFGGESSVFGASFNFTNSIVGAGIIGLPYAVQQCGLVLGVLLLLLVAVLVNRSVVMLIESGLKVGRFDLEDLAESLMGKTGYYCALLYMFLFAFGAQVGYLVIIGDSVPRVFALFYPESFLADRALCLLFFGVVVLLLSLCRQIETLSWTSLVSIVADVVIILIVLSTCTAAGRQQEDHFQVVTFTP
ncbi:transmembrane amino acid transporter protein-domain-containing protein [Ochromonadaceae sp. CCMP2298]|nr:transmembrane amino acid transporter protein-domain-containing protein [Ochromonadaceae sp. CCMP2298]